MEENTTQNQKNDEEKIREQKSQEAKDRLTNARYYKNFGGKIAMIVDKYPGVAELFTDKFVNDKKKYRLDSREFRRLLQEKFPQISEEELPSDSNLRYWRKKYFTSKTNELELAMRDEIRIIDTMQNFNFFEERMKLYNKSKDALKKAEEVLEKAYELSKKMNVPTAAFSSALGDFFKALEARGVHLDHLDSLAIRFGFMPSRNERNLFMNQQVNNYTLSDDHKQIKEELGLSDDDFSDENISGTFTKILNHYAKQSGKTILGIEPIESESESEFESKERTEVSGNIENSQGGNKEGEAESVGK